MIVVRAEHALHRLAGIAVSASGSCTLSSDLQALNRLLPSEVTPSGIVISLSPVELKASLSMLFRVEGGLRWSVPNSWRTDFAESFPLLRELRSQSRPCSCKTRGCPGCLLWREGRWIPIGNIAGNSSLRWLSVPPEELPVSGSYNCRKRRKRSRTRKSGYYGAVRSPGDWSCGRSPSEIRSWRR